MYPAKVDSPSTSLSADITISDTTIPVTDVSALPVAPNLAIMFTGSILSVTDVETILYTGISGNTLTGVTRGFQGTAKAWITSTNIVRTFTAYDHDTFKNNIEDLNTVIGGKAGTTVATTTTNGLESSEDKTKLDGIASGANNYTHPANHAPSVITQDSNNRFVTDTEKANWDAKIAGAGVTFEQLNTNGDVGVGVAQVAQGSHTHSDVYEPLDTHIMRKDVAQTMAATLTAQANTSYTTAQTRNITLSTSDPSGGGNGDVWIKYAV